MTLLVALSHVSLICLFQVVGMNWIEIPPGKYKVLSEKEKTSLCQLEVNIRFVYLHWWVNPALTSGQI